MQFDDLPVGTACKASGAGDSTAYCDVCAGVNVLSGMGSAGIGTNLYRAAQLFRRVRRGRPRGACHSGCNHRQSVWSYVQWGLRRLPVSRLRHRVRGDVSRYRKRSPRFYRAVRRCNAPRCIPGRQRKFVRNGLGRRLWRRGRGHIQNRSEWRRGSALQP